MLSAKDYEKLQHPEKFPLSAMIKLSQLRRRLSKKGYEFLHIKEGEAILLIEAARAIDCLKTKLLAQHFLKLMCIYDDELRPNKSKSGKTENLRKTDNANINAA